jgi:hypothetical protein
MADETENYKRALSDLIKKHMTILGPNIALDRAGKVPGLQIDQSGEVLSITGDARMVFKSVVHEYMGLSGQITQTVVRVLLEEHPEIKNI